MASNLTDRRVVVTGLGVVTPLGHDLETFWNNLISGQCGIDRITAFDAAAFDTQIAGEVRNFDPAPAFPSPKEIRRTDRYSQFGVYAAWSALKDSGADLDKLDRDEIGVILGSGIGGLETTTDATQNPDRARPGPALAVHDSDAHQQHGLRPVLDVSEFARAELRHLLRLRHRQQRHRRSLAHHQDGRGENDVRRRRRGGHRAHRHRRLLRDEGHEHAQRRSENSVASVRQGPRRLRHGRRRGRHRAGGTGTRQKARRKNLLRNRRLRQHRRRASSHRAVTRRRRRGALHENGPAQRRPEPSRTSTTSTPTAPPRHRATFAKRRPSRPFSANARRKSPSAPPRARPATCSARRARWR